MFFAHIFEENFAMAEGVVVAASAGEHTTASFWWQALLCGSHAFAGGTPLRGAKPCVLGFCVRGVLCVGHGASLFFANLLLGLGGGAGCGSLTWRVGGRRSTGWACRGRRDLNLYEHYIMKNSKVGKDQGLLKGPPPIKTAICLGNFYKVTMTNERLSVQTPIF